MPTKQDLKNSEIRKNNGLARCSKCKSDKPISDFNSCPSRRPFGLSSCCKSCDIKRKNSLSVRKYASLSKKEKRKKNLKGRLAKFGLSIDQYNELLKKQNNVCAICYLAETEIHHRTNEPRRLAVDHCHKTGKIRGLLCSACNKALGQFMEDIDRLKMAISYLERYKS